MTDLDKLNSVMFNTEISLKAKGLYAIIYDYKMSDIPATIKTLRISTSDKDKSIKRGLKELIDNGLIEMVRLRDEKNRFTGTVYNIV